MVHVCCASLSCGGIEKQGKSGYGFPVSYTHLDHCQVYKTRLGEFDDAKASVLGDYLPTKLKMDAGENVIFMVLPLSLIHI